MRQADDGKSFDLPSLQQFPDNEQTLNGLPNANVVGDEQADEPLLPKGHDQRHHLVRTRTERELRQGAEWPGTIAERQAG